jgi:hypothetical protein
MTIAQAKRQLEKIRKELSKERDALRDRTRRNRCAQSMGWQG